MLIDVDVSAADAVLVGKQEKLNAKQECLKKIAAVVRKAYGRMFSEAGPGWAPLAPSTIAAKARGGLPALTAKGNVPRRLTQNGSFGPGNILIATGALRDSYRQSGTKGHVEEYGKDTVSVGSRLTTKAGAPYAVYHQKGTKRGMPARPVGLSKEDTEEIADAVRSWLQSK